MSFLPSRKVPQRGSEAVVCPRVYGRGFRGQGLQAGTEAATWGALMCWGGEPGRGVEVCGCQRAGSTRPGGWAAKVGTMSIIQLVKF